MNLVRRKNWTDLEEVVDIVDYGLCWASACTGPMFYSKPHCVLFIHMVINDMLHLILTVFLLTITYVLYFLPASMCTIFTLVIISSTGNTPLNLACMALECYIAICYPLHYAKICTLKRTYMLIALMWLVTGFSGISDLLITLATSQLNMFNGKMVCLPRNIFPGPVVEQKRNFTNAILLFIAWFVILYTYFKIFFSAKTATKDIRKALNTIVWHGIQVLMCMTIYIVPGVRDFLIQLFPRSGPYIQFGVYIVVQILPRSLSPIVYGIRDTTLRKHMKAYFICFNRIVRTRHL